MAVARWTRRPGRGILRDASGASAVEFALLVPLLITIYFGLAETTQLMLAERRVSQVAYSVGDLVSRVDQIDNAQMADILTLSQVIMEPFPVSMMLGVRVTSVTVDTSGRASVVWSDATGTLNALLPGAPVVIKANLIKPGETVILSEVTYMYHGLSTLVLADGIKLGAKYYLKPRKSDAVTRISP